MRLNRPVLVAAALIGSVVPAHAVGLGPLSKEGITDGHGKAFYLSLINPYKEPRVFRAYAVAFDSDRPVSNVQIVPDRVILASHRTRKLTVIMTGLQPGEQRTIRVCAELEKQEGAIHARVCSKLSASRLRAGA